LKAQLSESAERSAQAVNHLIICREATARLLRVCESAVDSYLEDATTGPPKAYLCRGSQLKDLFPRRTGARFISSLTAIFDLDLQEIHLT
jgi:hypothetical protein